MERVVTNKQIYEILQVIEDLANVKAHFKFHYALNKTKKVLEVKMKSAPTYVPPKTEEYELFIKETNKKAELEKIKFEDISSFYEKELENYPEAKQNRLDSLEIFKTVVEEWELAEQEIFFHSIPAEYFPELVSGGQAHILTEYFLEQ